MHESPRLRRLHNDFASLERLRDESSVLKFRATGRPAQQYVIEFFGKSLARHRGKVSISDRHQVEIKLGASYPRTMPEIRWMTPIYHPNISEIGMVCLGGYGTHWVPSFNLEELVGMLWDVARYHNYNVQNPYNRDAALWVAGQAVFAFPLDPRPLRDLRAKLGRVDPEAEPEPEPSSAWSFQKLFGDRGKRKSEPESPHRERPVVEETEENPVVLEPVSLQSSSFESSPVAAPSPTVEPDGLIILEETVTHVSPERPARLRSQDEEILFID